MNDNTQEKNLIEKNENNVIEKIKSFFRNIFKKKEQRTVDNTDENVVKEKNNNFKEYVKKIDNAELEIYELQRKYRRGEIADGDLSQEQINLLCSIYDRQIADLKRTIRAKEIQVEKYKKM